MENEKNLVPTAGNAVANVPTLAQRVLKIQFHLQNMGQSAIIIGQELTECKKEVGHGNWANWIDENFHLTERTARRFMQIADRFSKTVDVDRFQVGQLTELLALPAGEEENFIAKKAANGTPVENMTVKKLREEIKIWKNKADELTEKNDKLQKQVDRHDEITDSNARAYNELVDAYEELRLQKSIEVLPSDYKENKEKILELQTQIDELQDVLNNTAVEIVPDDYYDIKQQLADLQNNQENLKIEVAISQALNQFFMTANFLNEHSDFLHKVLKAYLDSDPLTSQRIEKSNDVVTILKKVFGDISKKC